MIKKTIFIICVILFLGGAKNANAQEDSIFYYTGSMQTWTVPSCVFVITIDCYGAQGVAVNYENHPGYGGEARGVLAVIPGQTYNIFVGGQAGWNGGGLGLLGANGGDGSDVRYPSTLVTDRIIVAGGGGGSGGDNWQCNGGVYGNGGGGVAVGTYFVGGGGGLGYAYVTGCGGNGGSYGGTAGGNACHGGGGGGGGLYNGGAGAIETCSIPPQQADSGELGQGGASYNATDCVNAGEGTGGGGGGYYGGGGAAGFNCGAGQGGGGSSWTGNLTSPYFNFGTWTGNGEIIITYNNGLTPLILVVGQTNPTCGFCNGSITVTPRGGGPPYTYSWAPTGQTSQTATGLCAGTYTVTVSDSCGDVSTASTILIATAITVNTNVTSQDKCNGECNGSVTSSIILGTSPYTYNWQPGGESTATATGLCAGIYTLTVTDKNGCTGTATATITQPTAIVVRDTVTNPLCYSGTGSATVTATGGYSPYTYSWNPTAQTTATATGLSARTYTVTITDNVGCTATISPTITQPTQLTANTSVVSNILCNGGTGSAMVSAGGGTSPYTYLWNPTAQTTATATGLSARTYTVTVHDNNGCSTTATINMTQPAVLKDTISFIMHASCNLPNGKATVTATGGTTPYTYLWTPSAETTAIATGLSVGIYNVSVKDKDGCTTSATVSITEPSLVTASITATTNISCFNGGNGSATVTGAGGSTPYTYLWTPSANTNANATGLFAVSYTATVTDANGCTATTRTTLTQPSQLAVSISEPRIICKDSTGTLIANASGGTNPYKYNWSTGISSTNNTVSITPISTVYYTVTVADANGCTASNSITLQYGPSFAVAITGKGSVCAGDSAAICAHAIGALDGADYLWEPENNTNACITISPTQPSIYTVTVVDGCGATTTASTNVSIVPSPKVNMYANFYQGCEPLCIQFQNGTTISQGKISQYVWSFGDGDTLLTPNPIHCYQYSGSYNVTLTVVSDSGCNATLEKIDMITVYSPPKAAFTYSPNPTTIENPTITFTDESRDASDTSSKGGIIYRIWSFGDANDSTSYASNPSHTYKDTGTYCASLFVMNTGGCTDTITNCLMIDPAFKLYIPSAFTPNGDERNETFQAVGQYVKSFEMYVFNRWGMEIYHSTSISEGWNGKVDGSICQEDVYVYKITVMDSKDVEHSYIGNVTLIK